jgi:hypothetical protein
MAQHERMLLDLLEVQQILDNLCNGQKIISHKYTTPPIDEPIGNQRTISYQVANSMTSQFALNHMFDCTTKLVAL